MPTSTPVEVFTDWLGLRPREARVVVAIDVDRLVCESGLLGRNTIVDKNGREWQLAVFRGDDLAFRLRFRKASAHSSTAIVLTRGEGSDEKIEVSHLTDILARNEGGPPLDLSLPAFFKRLSPKINFPPAELRRHKNALLERLNAVPAAAAKIVERWGRPDDWGRGQVAAMIILARHPELTVRDLWPNETEAVDFVAHALRLVIGSLQLAEEHLLIQEMIREAAQPQVREHLYWLDVPREELAAYLVLRRFAADVQLQNPSTQLTGLQIFSPDMPLARLEPLVLRVAVALHSDPTVWLAVETLAESFLTPRRLEKVMALVPMAEQDPDTLVETIRKPRIAPVILKQYLLLLLSSFFRQPSLTFLTWTAKLANHPLLTDASNSLSLRARECRAALHFLQLIHQIERKLALSVPDFPHPETLLDWYISSEYHKLEFNFSQAFHYLEDCGDTEITVAGVQYMFGESEDLDPSPSSLKGRIRSRLDTLDHRLAEFVRADPDTFARGPRSVLTLVQEKIRNVTEQITAGVRSGHVWILLFDGMRFDTWETIVRPILAEHFSIEDSPYFCVLPSYTSIARTSLFAGCLPSKWRGYKNSSTKDEATLLARNLGLTQQEIKTKLRFVTEADTVKARMRMGFTDNDAKLVNVLIYPISDDCHEFRGDLTAFNNKIRTEILGDKVQGVRGILDDLLRRIRPEDTVLATSDHGFIELLARDAILVTQAEVESAGRVLQDDVRDRYIKGFRPSQGNVVEVPGVPDPYFVAVGQSWFRREGARNTQRYQHGGLSLAEMVIPGSILKRVTEKDARAEIVNVPVGTVMVDEDKQVEIPLAVRNVGNVPLEFEVQARTNLVEDLLSHRGKLAAQQSYLTKLTISGQYRETLTKEIDPSGTITALTVRLKHTDLKGHWRDALDGVITIPIKVKPKKTRLDTDALRGFDDV